MSVTQWGIYDTVDEVWIGDADGPAFHQDWNIARLAAMIVEKRFGWEPGRCRAQIRPPCRAFRERDTVEVKMGNVEALKRLEGGEL